MLKPIDQNTARFTGLVGLDGGYGGIADDEAEGKRIAAALGRHPILLMGNHGLSSARRPSPRPSSISTTSNGPAGPCLLAYASGQSLNVMSDAVASKTAADWREYTDSAFAHFEQLKTLLDAKDRSYRE